MTAVIPASNTKTLRLFISTVSSVGSQTIYSDTVFSQKEVRRSIHTAKLAAKSYPKADLTDLPG
jgi:hypothetical protein